MNKSSGEQVQAATDTPDRYTLAWWKEQLAEVQKGYRGATHGINRCQAEYEQCTGEVQELRKLYAASEQKRAESDAEIARIRAQIKGLAETIEKAREAYAKLQSK